MRSIRIILILILSFLVLSSPAFSLDLDASNFYPNIIKSLEKKEHGWFIHSSYLIFARKDDIEPLKKCAFPDIDARPIIILSYSLFFNGGFVITKKPINETVPPEYSKKILKQIKIMVMDKLYKEGIRRSSDISEINHESKVQNELDSEKINMEGRKL